MRTFLAMALMLSVFAGCLDEDPILPPAEPAGGDEPQYEDDRGVVVDQPGQLPVTPPQPGERTAESAPQWRLGEYWVVEVSDYLTGGVREARRVVAGTEHGNYLVGFPLESFSNEIMVLHMPGFGDVLPDLSYDAHDVPFQPLSFPLHEGKQWTTQWEGGQDTMNFLVDTVTNETVEMTISSVAGGGYSGRAIYDIEMGEISMLDLFGYAKYEIKEHGFGYEGVVRVPHAHDLVFFHGRLAGVADASQPLVPPTPSFSLDDSIQIPDSYDQLSFALIFVDIAGQVASGTSGQQVGAVGAYSIEATAPDGDVFAATYLPNEMDGGFKTVFFGKTEPSGTWNLRAIAGGPGIALLEGIGYHSIDIDLPTGCVLASANANHHGTLCKA